jgi:hypothetical protein
MMTYEPIKLYCNLNNIIKKWKFTLSTRNLTSSTYHKVLYNNVTVAYGLTKSFIFYLCGCIGTLCILASIDILILNSNLTEQVSNSNINS